MRRPVGVLLIEAVLPVKEITSGFALAFLTPLTRKSPPAPISIASNSSPSVLAAPARRNSLIYELLYVVSYSLSFARSPPPLLPTRTVMYAVLPDSRRVALDTTISPRSPALSPKSTHVVVLLPFAA